jgi:hypothetical protein
LTTADEACLLYFHHDFGLSILVILFHLGIQRFNIDDDSFQFARQPVGWFVFFGNWFAFIEATVLSFTTNGVEDWYCALEFCFTDLFGIEVEPTNASSPFPFS